MIKAQIEKEKKRRKEKALLDETFGHAKRSHFIIKRKNAK